MLNKTILYQFHIFIFFVSSWRVVNGLTTGRVPGKIPGVEAEQGGVLQVLLGGSLPH